MGIFGTIADWVAGRYSLKYNLLKTENKELRSTVEALKNDYDKITSNLPQFYDLIESVVFEPNPEKIRASLLDYISNSLGQRARYYEPNNKGELICTDIRGEYLSDILHNPVSEKSPVHKTFEEGIENIISAGDQQHYQRMLGEEAPVTKAALTVKSPAKINGSSNGEIKKYAIIVVDNGEEERELTNEQFQILKFLTGIYSMALERVELYKKLNSVIEELENKNKIRADIVSSVSHELRSPLTNVKMYLGALISGKYGELAPDQIKNVEVIARNVETLLDFTNVLLDVSKIEANKFDDLKPRYSSLTDIIKERAEFYRPIIEQNGLTIETEPQNVFAYFDTLKVSQHILNNLISNSSKHTEKGGIKLGIDSDENGRIKLYSPKGEFLHHTISFSEDGKTDIYDGNFKIDEQLKLEIESMSYVMVYVKDTGKGIEKKELEAIFEPFKTIAEDAKQYDRNSTGLGLAIAKKFVENHGGIIKADSKIGEGTTVCFTLPLTETAYNEFRHH